MVDELGVLKTTLEDIERITNEEWLTDLAARKKKELEFHDRYRERESAGTIDKDTYERLYGNKKYYVATNRSRRYMEAWLAKWAPGRVFLDYACGNGMHAIRAAQCGARLAIGLDISRVSVVNARADAAASGVSNNTFFVQADAENTKLPKASVDSVLCSGMLHHLDLSYAFPELRRILKPGGRILAVEALDYNPGIKLYRRITPDMRTDWEKAHILSWKDLRFAQRFFQIGEVRYWHITEIIAPHFPWAEPLLARIDPVLERIPGLRLMAWIFTFELIKPVE